MNLSCQILRRFILGCLLPLIFTATLQAGPSSSPREKSYALGTALAILPANGAGLIYAGQKPLGYSLLGAEALGLGLFIAGFGAITCEADCSSNRDDILFVTGLGLLAGSYLADVIGTPFAIASHNRKVRASLGMTPLISTARGQPRWGLGLQGSF